ncbi:hypothetical protein AAG906_035728 [Vitis piasezkii]
MDGEDWPDPLPKGWTLKKYSNGKVWAHNTRTGQTFHTKKDLLRYVRYAENVLPLFANFSKGIWGIDDVEIIERTSSHASVIVTDVPNAHNNQLPERNMKVQADQQPETKMKTKTVTEHQRNKRAGPPKKFKMPPKRFRGSGSRKNRHQNP